MPSDGTRPSTRRIEFKVGAELVGYIGLGGVFEVDGWSELIGVYECGGASSARTKEAVRPQMVSSTQY